MDEDVDEDVAKVFTNNKKGKNDVAVINKLNFFRKKVLSKKFIIN